MARTISIGSQTFSTLRENNCFYIDKTNFIKEWWESSTQVTLITRPRRFGKTLNMNMLECFFSNHYKNRSDLFEGLSIWSEEKFRKMQGTYPVIFLSFANIKQDTYQKTLLRIKKLVDEIYNRFPELANIEGLTEEQKAKFTTISDKNNEEKIDEVELENSIHELSMYLERYYKKKVIILLDEYDTPMQEAYINGFWDEVVAFMRSFFNSTFKTNPYLDRAVLTGITRVSKESIFSDFNNPDVITTTSSKYATCFGFTEKEVFDSLDEMGLSDRKEEVKNWYDGFVFGNQRDIYNPWSITNFLDKKILKNYWSQTSSNSLIGKLLREGSAETKENLEDLIEGKAVVKKIDEQIVFNYLDKDEEAIWSLLLASGYLKSENVDYRGETSEPYHTLRITNIETKGTIENLMKGWFSTTGSNYNSFVKYLLEGDKKAMNHYMNKIALETFSLFDVAGKPSEYAEPERFYHGFVLGLMVDRREDYIIKSNRESGFGRYDVVMIPKDKQNPKTPAIVLEFKVFDKDDEKDLQDSVNSALQQIQNKNYDADLIKDGVNPSLIRHYGFAFCGKNVLIG
ncbi:MAG: ATP-binding protein [Spirochaetia bacterium]|nr:ATP-binding protein [Spirochaetia bacterium]MDY4131097.1 AAA family ATPase [Treponema sp.]